jgi:tetratricopeptide (TPR) repeat protein
MRYMVRVDVRNLGDAFRVVMDHNGWSGARLARELGVPQPWVSMVLGGRRDPGMRRAAELLAQTGWELYLVPSEDDVKRRAFLLAVASVAFVPAATASPYSDPAYVGMLTTRLTASEEQMGGAPLAREAVRHVARAVPAARAGGTSLQAAASALCRQAALVLHDVRRLDQAEETAATALALGCSAGDPAAQAGACDTLSLITAHLPDGRGAAYARRGLALAEGDDRAMLAARLGRSLALQGDAGQARASLEHALELADGQSAEITGNVGIGLADLGLPGRAEPCLATAVRLTASSPFLRSLYVARQAKTAIRARQLDQAVQEMTALATLAPLVESPRLTIHLRHIYDGTKKWAAISEVQDAREALREAMA